ncbi:aldehyde dehydrogenase family protein [Streptomyces sp. NPDC001508]|uniref:aldehyde dehydrogenase family protein n=1 Tax=Streptomyces sp. NPDC001508 TaxID=3154656 RepID=UPI00332FBA93
MVAIAGSIDAGAEVVLNAAVGMKRFPLELGGKAPAILHRHARLEAVVAGISEDAFFNVGQDVHDDFLDRLTGQVTTDVLQQRRHLPGAASKDLSRFGSEEYTRTKYVMSNISR